MSEGQSLRRSGRGWESGIGMAPLAFAFVRTHNDAVVDNKKTIIRDFLFRIQRWVCSEE